MRTSLVLYIKLYFRSPRNERRVIRTTGEGKKEYAPLYCRRLHVCHKDTDLDRAPAKVPLHLTYDRLSSLHLSSIGSTATFFIFSSADKESRDNWCHGYAIGMSLRRSTGASPIWAGKISVEG